MGVETWNVSMKNWSNIQEYDHNVGMLYPIIQYCRMMQLDHLIHVYTFRTVLIYHEMCHLKQLDILKFFKFIPNYITDGQDHQYLRFWGRVWNSRYINIQYQAHSSATSCMLSDPHINFDWLELYVSDWILTVCFLLIIWVCDKSNS